VTGLYVRTTEFDSIMSQLSADAGWSPVDQDLHARVEKIFVAVLSPKHLFVGSAGMRGHSDLMAVGVINVPNDKRPTMFGATSMSRLAYVFPTNRSIVQVAMDADFGAANTFVAKLTPVTEGVRVHIMLMAKSAAAEQFDVVKDVCAVFCRVPLTAADL